MAKKIRKKERRKITRRIPGLLVLAAAVIVIVAIGMISGFNEPDEILSGLLLEIALYGTVIAIGSLIIWLIRNLKRTGNGEGGDSPLC
jgi:hypothetical protein